MNNAMEAWHLHQKKKGTNVTTCCKSDIMWKQQTEQFRQEIWQGNDKLLKHHTWYLMEVSVTCEVVRINNYSMRLDKKNISLLMRIYYSIIKF
jgi:hypothetical protein